MAPNEMLSAIVLLLNIYFMKRRVRENSRRNALARRRAWRHRQFERALTEELTSIVGILSMMESSRCMMIDNVLKPWSLPKSDFWWKTIVIDTFEQEDWLSHFRMSWQTFNFLCGQLRPIIQKMDTKFRVAIRVEHRVAITLWRLATNVEYRTIAQMFGVGTSTVCCIVHQVCRAIVVTLANDMIRIPRGDAAADVVREFEVKWGFPQCFGAIDGSHIPVLSPKEFRADYYNRKGFYSMVLQGLVDHRYRFMNINFGYPGSVHDARVFTNSRVFRLGNEGELCPPLLREIGETQVPVAILGDSAYPLLPWLMKPFHDNGQLTREKRHFNYRLSRARMVVENGFGRLKGRWRILLKRQDTHVKYLGDLVVACCVLHNLCESAGENFDLDLLGANGGDGQAPNVPGMNDEQNRDATRIRNALLQHLTDA
eukprot:XP_003731101.1 PREDICTED: putative nuclease HARBI1 [Strongylocentrotus purpuratus]